MQPSSLMPLSVALVVLAAVGLPACATGDPVAETTTLDSARSESGSEIGSESGGDTGAGVDSSATDTAGFVDSSSGDTAAGDGAGDTSSDDTAPVVDTGVPPGDGGADTGCGATPTLHLVPTPPTVYCPFSATTSGGKDIYCAAGKQCCETPISAGTPSTCVAVGSACPVTGSLPIECDGPSNCTGTAKVCCGVAKTIGPKPGCTYDSAVSWKGTKCAAACAVSEFTICDSAAACATGTCTPFKAAGAQYGYCK